MLRMGPPLRTDERLLVRLPNWLGDLVMAEPAVRALYLRYAADGAAERLSLAAPAHLLTIFEDAFEGARRIPLADRRDACAEAWRGHDVALLLTGSFRTAWAAVRARIPRRVGWARDGRGWLLTTTMRPALERGGLPLGVGTSGRGRRYLPRPFGASCIELLGLLGVSVADTRPRLAVPPELLDRVRARLADAGWDLGAPFALANVGSRPESAKGYPAELWGRALESLARDAGLPVLLVGGPGEREAVRAVASGLRDTTHLALLDPPATLRELAALCSLAGVVLTADSGPRHVAEAVGAPVACVAGPTDPRHTADHLETTRLVRVEVPCGPCHLERCPERGEDWLRCMKRVEPERLARAALDLYRYDAGGGSPR